MFNRLLQLRERQFWVLTHRYVGLLIAVFLIFSGVTGAVISWDHELDELLNPHLTKAASKGVSRSSLEVAKMIEASYPEVMVTSFPLAAEPGESLEFNVSPRVNPATRQLYQVPFNQVFIDPVSGQELGKREWGAVWPITKETFVSFLYKLHFSLQIPEIGGTDRWGIWILGVIAIMWTLDCFVGFYLTLPVNRTKSSQEHYNAKTTASWWKRWMPAWKVRWCGGARKLNFDLHRAFSLWTWGLLFVIAFTAFSLNLYSEVFFPIMSTVSKVTPSPFETRTPTSLNEPINPKISLTHIIKAAATEAKSHRWNEPVGAIFYAPNFGVYGVEFYYPRDGEGVGGVGHKQLYYDAIDGRYLGVREPWKGTAADIFVQAQFPIHSGRILGLPGRILISMMGIVVAMLSVTGVIIWWRKYRSRTNYNRIVLANSAN